jgi:hypothetical protein
MTMHLRQKFLWLVLEWWEDLLLSHTFNYWLILLGSHVQFVIEIVHIVLDLAELGFKLRFLVVPLEKRVGSFHQLGVIGSVVTAIKGHGCSLARPAGQPISTQLAARE